MNPKKHSANDIMPVYYEPPATYGLDLEIMPIAVLRQRVSKNYLRTRERIDFHLMIYLTEGRCTHMVDFESIDCRQGSLLMLHPGQVHCFDASTHWQGWMIIFRPEFLLPREPTTLVTELEAFRHIEELPTHFSLNECEQQIMLESITRMHHDTQIKASANALHTLLRNQLHTILNRLYLIVASTEQAERADPALLQRFKRYRFAVEQNFHRAHQVAEYAKCLGYSEKSLSRAVLEFAGISAKAFLSKRIALEAKRLLAHTGLPVSIIAHKLGFDEPTNFIKFFRREAGCSPGDFRQRHTGTLSDMRDGDRDIPTNL